MSNGRGKHKSRGRRDTPEESGRRDRSWARGQARKQARREAQEARERANKERTGPTPWEQAKALRKALRSVVRKDAA